MADPTFVRSELDELEKRLMKMDLKLKTAKKARDEYVNFLQQKYPSWKPPEMQLYKQPSLSNQFQGSVLDNLATTKYHWDLRKPFITPYTKPELDNLEPNDPMPSKIKKRLSEIAEDLDNLRNHRLHLSTPEYYLSLGHEFHSSKYQEMPWKKDIIQMKNLHELRTQINQIDTSVLTDTPRPNAEDYERIRMDYLEKYTNIVADEKNDNQNVEKYESVFTDTDNNFNAISIKKQQQQNESSLLQETHSADTNLILGETQTHNLSQMLDTQNDDKKLSNQEKVVIKNSRPTEIGNIWQASHVPEAPDDGLNFLTKILGTSAVDVGNKKPTLTDRFNDVMHEADNLNADDSDSDFFS